jgi:hypothetical protein
MSQAERFAHLLQEFERVGVDPNTISAGLAVREQDVLLVLASLPNGAGPTAFLTQLRMAMSTSPGPDDESAPR